MPLYLSEVRRRREEVYQVLADCEPRDMLSAMRNERQLFIDVLYAIAAHDLEPGRRPEEYCDMALLSRDEIAALE